jgi:hypothetical protein
MGPRKIKYLLGRSLLGSVLRKFWYWSADKMEISEPIAMKNIPIKADR